MDAQSCAERPKHRTLQLHNTLSVLPSPTLGEAFPPKTHFGPLACTKSTPSISTPLAPQDTRPTPRASPVPSAESCYCSTHPASASREGVHRWAARAVPSCRLLMSCGKHLGIKTGSVGSARSSPLRGSQATRASAFFLNAGPPRWGSSRGTVSPSPGQERCRCLLTAQRSAARPAPALALCPRPPAEGPRGGYRSRSPG